ncbi:hypothetical protein ACFY8O_34105 [Streptomyces argenteolus]|uniref:WXG100 family type VII secretion target n=1 Tax=Streptomyces argenteolus TaxID=67274 RepID=A0ABW6XGQ0_9ACTN
MGEANYQADVPGIGRSAKALESLMLLARRIHSEWETGHWATAGWQGVEGRGDSLADQLTAALALEFRNIKDALDSVNEVFSALSPASDMGSAVQKPSDDAVGMIAEAGGRH